MHLPVLPEHVIRNRRIAHHWERLYKKPWADIWSAVSFEFNDSDAWSKRLYDHVSASRLLVCVFCGKGLSWWELSTSPKALRDFGQLHELRCFYHRDAVALPVTVSAFYAHYAHAAGVA